MKKFLMPVLVISLIMTAGSCKTLMMKANRVTKPKMETENSILAYLKEKEISCEDGLFICKDSLSFLQVLKIIRNLPSVDFFTPEGTLIRYSTTGDCAGEAKTFAQNLNTRKDYEIDPSYVLKDLEGKLKMISGKSTLNDDEIDFITFVYWAKYLGKMNNSVFDVIKALKENKRIRTRINLINVDFMEEWGMKEVIDFQLE